MGENVHKRFSDPRLHFRVDYQFHHYRIESRTEKPSDQFSAALDWYSLVKILKVPPLDGAFSLINQMQDIVEISLATVDCGTLSEDESMHHTTLIPDDGKGCISPAKSGGCPGG